MKLLERIILSKILYPLWHIAWIEQTFFHACRLFGHIEQAAFQFYNFGFDVSKWQGIINFVKMVAYGAKFLILRCAYGIKIDERFIENMAGVGNLLPLSAYHYYDPIYSPESQAAKVIEVLAPYKSRIRRVWLDLEFYWNGSYSDPKHWKTYRDRIKAAGYRIGWYTRATWWDSRVGSYASEFAKDPCWAAQYNSSLTLIPKGWTKVMIWQNGTPAIGSEAGTDSKEIDNDIWNDEFSFFDEWNKELDGGAPPPPAEPPVEPPGEPMPTITIYHLTVTASPAKRWSDAACTNRIYPDIPNGTKLESQVKSGSNYYIGNGYVKGSQVRLDYVETVEEPTEPPVEPPVEPPPVTPLPVTLKGFDATGTEIPGAIWDKRNAP